MTLSSAGGESMNELETKCALAYEHRQDRLMDDILEAREFEFAEKGEEELEGEDMSETKEYIQSEERCLEGCKDKVCLRCGMPLSPIETVDNSNRPTFWGGCLNCMIYSPGTSKEIYDIANKISADYRHTSMDDICRIIQAAFFLKEAR
jgi:hypothetical protein